MNLPRLNSSVNSCKNIKYVGIILNNMVLEEINKKMKNNIKENEKSNRIRNNPLISSMMTNSFKINNEEKLSTSSSDYNKLIFQYKHPYLRKSANELSFKRNLRIKSSMTRNIIKYKNRDFSVNKAVKISLDVKRIFSPLEISSSKNKDNSISNKIKINNTKDKKELN